MNREAEFLREQLVIAKTRLRLHASALADELVAPLRLGSLVRQKPWWSLGGALVGGFLAGFGLRALARSRPVRAAPAHLRQFLHAAPARVRHLVHTAPARIRRLVATAARNWHRVLGGALPFLASQVRQATRGPAAPSSNGHSHHPSHRPKVS